MKTCPKCQTSFEITDQDFAFYEKIDAPPPTLCPECRIKRRMIFRNERHLYQRQCDLCKKNILSIFAKNKLFPVYCYDCWWSDKWSAHDYTREFNPSMPFFTQLAELFKSVPHLAIISAHCENSDYVNYTNYSKNCYLIFGCHAAENCYYGWRVHDSLECVDCLQIDKSKFCYECIDCDTCYCLFYSQDCTNCSDSSYLYDCKDCSNCLFCTGLRNRQHCIFNKQFSQKNFEVEKSKLDLSTAKNQYNELLKKYPRRTTSELNCENSSGDHIINCKNIRTGFNVKNAQDGAYLESCEDIKDAMDSTFCGWPAELNYEGISAGCVNSYNTKFCDTCWTVTNVEYCSNCHHSKDLFGCFGLKNQNRFCILNRQYSEQEFTGLKSLIISQMKSKGEYGEFFPSELSPFTYNETVANDYFPLTKEQAAEQGFRWIDPTLKDSTPSEISCQNCQKNFRIVAQEQKFYEKFSLPTPEFCFNCRHQSRMNKRNPRRLWQRECNTCKKTIQSTYNPSRSEIILCENCYLKTTY